MSYQALYRLYRPQRFDEIVGQDAITKTLKNAIANDLTSHAYLFTGPRGTGKTSAAKIFAKAVNCPHQEKGEPCNDCEICQAITEGSLGDVMEIDAASNNGVDEIREIREKANYSPAVADYKIYIIDEVHMLSQGAFNALLKTLEEPPPNVIFILATTEPHKIPLTIISRTQRFDFKRISTDELVHRMEIVLGEEGLAYEDEALEIIARSADGGMRDALSILDQAITFADGRLNQEDAIQVTGSLSQDLLVDFFTALKDKNTSQALKLVQETLQEGKSPSRFVEDAILFSRDLLMEQVSPQEADLLEKAKWTEDFHDMALAFSSEDLYEMIRIFNECQHQLKASNHALVYIEVAVIKICQARPQASIQEGGLSANLTDIEEMKNDLAEIQELVQKQDQPQTKRQDKQAAQGSRPNSSVSFRPNMPGIHRILEKATRPDLVRLQEVWPDLLSALTPPERSILKASQPVAASESGVVVAFQYEILGQKLAEDDGLKSRVAAYLKKVLGQDLDIQSVTVDQWKQIRENFYKQTLGVQEDQATLNPPVDPELREEDSPEKDEKAAIVEKAIELFGEENIEIEE